MRKIGLSTNNMEKPFIKEMFETIAPKYDFLNRLLSLRQDVYWRRKMVSAMRISNNGTALDAACGTCDVAIEIAKQKGTNIKIFGIDFALPMLQRAVNKIKHTQNHKNIHLLAGNLFNLPFQQETFDAITIAFGIRNINDKLSVLKKFHSVLKDGGMLLVLELTMPERGFLLSCYLFYFKLILPLLGRLFSRDPDAYQYLPSSVENFPAPNAFASIMRSAGFKNIELKKLTLGIVILYIGYKN